MQDVIDLIFNKEYGPTRKETLDLDEVALRLNKHESTNFSRRRPLSWQ